MKGWVLFATLTVFIMLQTTTVYANNHLFEEKLKVIENFALRICQTVPTESSRREVRFVASVEAELPKLLKKLANLGFNIEYDQETSLTSGVPQKDLKEVIADANKCRAKLVDTVFLWLSTDTPEEKIQDKHNEEEKQGRYSEREKNVQYVLSMIPRFNSDNRYIYLSNSIPKIKGGIMCGEFAIMIKEIEPDYRYLLISNSVSYINSITNNCRVILIDLLPPDYRLLAVNILGT